MSLRINYRKQVLKAHSVVDAPVKKEEPVSKTAVEKALKSKTTAEKSQG